MKSMFGMQVCMTKKFKQGFCNTSQAVGAVHHHTGPVVLTEIQQRLPLTYLYNTVKCCVSPLFILPKQKLLNFIQQLSNTVQIWPVTCHPQLLLDSSFVQILSVCFFMIKQRSFGV